MIFIGKLKATSKNQKAVAGIYVIRNLVNNKVYVGSSVDIYTRYWTHNSELTKGTHYNSHLQNAWNKYHSDNFTFSIIELVECDKIKLLEREQFWIDTLDACNRKNGYNISPIAGNCLGVKMTEEQVIANRLRQKGKPVLQFDLEGNLIKEWHSIGELCRELNVPRSTVNSSLKNSYKFKEKYYLIFKDGFTYEILNEQLSKKDGRIGRKCPPMNKKVNQYDKDGTFIKTWESITIARESLNVKHISSACNGKRKTAGGFIWAYAN